MNKNVYLVIMAGGVGSRFWPYSRREKPKQFLDVLGTGKSLLQMTYERFLSLTSPERVLVVTHERYKHWVREQLPQLHEAHLLAEPMKKNTAPCLAYAAYKIRRQDPEAMMIVTPADHAIFQEDCFVAVIEKAVRAAGEPKLLTIGITPNRPETGYGYIQYIENAQSEVKKVKTFTEKPEHALAKKFLASGDFVWNAGIFIWSIPSIIQAFESLLPDMAQLFSAGHVHYYAKGEQAYIEEIYPQCKSISIDYGILEKSSRVFVVKGAFDWSDLGAWHALHELRDKDEQGNAVSGNVVLGDCLNNIIQSETQRLLVLDDLEGYLIGDFHDVLIVCKKDQERKFRDYVAQVKRTKGEQYL